MTIQKNSIRKDLGESGGPVVNVGIGDWISVAAGVLGGIYGLYLVSSKFRPEILELWQDKWAVTTESSESN